MVKFDVKHSEIEPFLSCMHDIGVEIYHLAKDNLPRAYFVKDFLVLPIEVAFNPPQILYKDNNGDKSNEQLVFRCLKRRRIQQER